MTLTLGDINRALTGQEQALPDVAFTQVVIDSREARPGALFVALAGEHVDGHQFVKAAFAAGARGALVKPKIRRDPPANAICWEPGHPLPPGDQPICIVVPEPLAALQQIAAWWRRQFPACRVVGITGSVGKTTTKELVAAVMSQGYETLRNVGNLNNEIGLPLTVLQLGEEHERAVLEMGMYDLGEIALLAEIAQPSLGVVTNVRPIHLERLGTMERIAQAKAELVEALPAEGIAVLNGDDPRVRAMASKTQAERIVTFGLDPGNQIWADEIENHGWEGVAFRLHGPEMNRPVQMPLLGTHHVWAALAAAAIGWVEGLSEDQIVAGLEAPQEPLRMVTMPGLRGSTILDDTYNAGPSSTMAALRFMSTLPGRSVAVLGDMLELGSMEHEAHRQVGEAAAKEVDVLLTVGPRARGIAEAAAANGLSAAAITSAADNAEAVRHLVKLIEPNDIVLVKGSRGMAMEDIVQALKEKDA